MAVVEFWLKLEKGHTFFLWTLGCGLRGPAGDMAILDQEATPETSGAIMWSFKMGADSLGGLSHSCKQKNLDSSRPFHHRS